MWGLPITITAVLILFTTGLSIMIIPVNNMLSIQGNVITYFLWGIALIWLCGMLFHRRHKIEIGMLQYLVSVILYS